MKKSLIIIAIIFISTAILKSDLGLFDGILETASVSEIHDDVATSGGYIELTDDDLDVTQKGIVWSTNSNPTLASNVGYTQEGAGPNTGGNLLYESQMTDLVYTETYYVRAYFTNGDGTFYGQEVSFVSIPTLGQWGLIIFSLLLAGVGGRFLWKNLV